MIYHSRRQHPVGQGFFHSGEVNDSDGTCAFLYVVDCGSKLKYQSQRDVQIDNFIRAIGAGSTLDLLLVSHVHEDHVNGIGRLLDATSGLRVDTIMMPLMTVEERLIAFTASAMEDPAAASSDFYQRFTADPLGALAEFRPRQIILVRPGGPDDGAPGGTEGPLEPLPGDGPDGKIEAGEPRREWRLVGKGRAERPDDLPGQKQASSAVEISVIPDSAGIAVPFVGGQWDWLIAPYVDSTVVADVGKFERELARKLKIPVANLRKQLVSPSYVQNLIVNDVNKLKAAYAKVARDLNVTSLCVYSGPARAPGMNEARCIHAHFGNHVLDVGHGGGWLGTGDAALKEHVRLDPFLQHYDHLLREVSTLTMPHHGSDANFNPDLLDQVKPTLCVAAADRIGNWRHPGMNVVQCIASRGLLLLVATSDVRSGVDECMFVGRK